MVNEKKGGKRRKNMINDKRRGEKEKKEGEKGKNRGRNQ